MSMRLRLMTWNIHGAVGRDGRCEPARILSVIEEVDPDILVLQEVDGRTRLGRRAHAFETFREALGDHVVEARMFGRPGREHGNLLWSRMPFSRATVHPLPRGVEPRGLIEARVETPSGSLRIFGTHFSLSIPARRRQARFCADLIVAEQAPAVLCGDFNEWRRSGAVHRTLSAVAPVDLRSLTWPSRRPFVAMDRIYATGAIILDPLAPPAAAGHASDHLPVVAEVQVAGSRAPAGSEG